MTSEKKENVGDTAVEDPVVSSAKIKLPLFWPNNPTTWFIQAEAQFSLNNVSSDNTRYYHIVSALPAEVCDTVIDILSDPPKSAKYESIKKALIDRHSASEEKQLEELLGQQTLGDMKPSALFRSMKGLAGNTFTDAAIKRLWIRRLPPAVKASVVGAEKIQTDLSVDKLMGLADGVYETLPSSHVASVHSRSPQPHCSRELEPTSFPVRPDSGFEARMSRLESMMANMAAIVGSNNHNFRGRRRSNSRRRVKSPARNFQGQKPICRLHRKYGDNANFCIKPCYFYQQKSMSTPNQKN